MENLINTKEAAAILGISPKTLEKWRERKIFGVPFFTADERHGNTWYYYREVPNNSKPSIKKAYCKACTNSPTPSTSSLHLIFRKEPQAVTRPSPMDSTRRRPSQKLSASTKSTLSRWRDKQIFVEDY